MHPCLYTQRVYHRGLKGFNGRPIVTCDNAILTAKRRGLKGLNVQPIVTHDNAIVMAKKAQIEGLQCMAYCDLWQWHHYCMGAWIERFQYAADCLVKLGVPWQGRFCKVLPVGPLGKTQGGNVISPFIISYGYILVWCFLAFHHTGYGTG